MVDFVDYYPPQLSFYPEDKRAFLDEARMSLRWHRDVVGPIYRRYEPDVFLHNVYTPNQMLTSRWWLGYIDPESRRYGDVGDDEREGLMGEVLEMYRGLDEIVGRAVAGAGEQSLIVLSSDHGAAPLDRWVRLNNLFASKGWLHHGVDPATGRVSDPRHPDHGVSVAGTVLALRETIGSSSSSAVMLELIAQDLAPRALLLGRADAILTLGVVVAREMGMGSIPVLRVDMDRLPDEGLLRIAQGGEILFAG